MFCTKCGTKIPDNAAFCPGCGSRINNSEGKTYSPSTNQGNTSNKQYVASCIEYLQTALCAEQTYDLWDRAIKSTQAKREEIRKDRDKWTHTVYSKPAPKDESSSIKASPLWGLVKGALWGIGAGLCSAVIVGPVYYVMVFCGRGGLPTMKGFLAIYKIVVIILVIFGTLFFYSDEKKERKEECCSRLSI